MRMDREPRWARRSEDDLSRERKDAIRELKAGVSLANDEDALIAIGVERLHLGVMRHLVEPWDRRTVRLGHAGRDNEHACAVLPVRGGEDVAVAVAVAARRLPPAAVTDNDVRPIREIDKIALHLGARREIRGTVHERGHQATVRFVLREQAVPVVALVVARRPWRG